MADTNLTPSTDWIHEGTPPWRSHAQVWLRDGSVREVDAADAPIGIVLYFTDCTHPLQNMICDRDKVQAWRLVG